MNEGSKKILRDSRGRKINYLRLSVTDACNLHCVYCMPQDAISRAESHAPLLDFKDITKIVRVLANMGITKVRLTGGEPLARKNISSLIGMLSAIEGILEITMTSNGIEMAKQVDKLKAAGLASVNIHLDSLKPSTYRLITGSGMLNKALEGIEASINSSIDVKLNTVLMRGINDTEVEELIAFASKLGIPIRFIELMPMGAATDFCKKHFISIKEIMARLGNKFALSQIQKISDRGPATYYKISESNAVVGFIGCRSSAFCDSCNRLRLLSDGTLMNCIATSSGLSLSRLLNWIDDEGLKKIISEYITTKPDGHAGFIRTGLNGYSNMHAIGG